MRYCRDCGTHPSRDQRPWVKDGRCVGCLEWVSRRRRARQEQRTLERLERTAVWWTQ